MEYINNPFKKEYGMECVKSLFLIFLASFPSVAAIAQNNNKASNTAPTKVKPVEVKKELRIKALNEEIKCATTSHRTLKKKLDAAEKDSDEYKKFELRLMLKDDYLRGLNGLKDMETGKIKDTSEEKYEGDIETGVATRPQPPQASPSGNSVDTSQTSE